MLAFVFSIVDFADLRKTFLSIPTSTFLIVILGYGVGQVISTYKWWTIAKAAGIETSFLGALRAYFIGMFVNCFGLGVVGGDMARGVLVAGSGDKVATGVATVVADRAQGLGVLALIGAFSAALFGRNAIELNMVLALTILGLGIVVAWIFAPALVRRFSNPEKKLHQKILEASDAFPKDWNTILFICLISAVFHFLQIALHWVMCIGLGASVSWLVLLVTIPFVNILSSLPISWNGLGVRENAYIFFLAPAFLSQEQAVALGAVWLIAITFCSTIGGIWAVATKEFSVFTRKSQEGMASSA